MERIFVLDAVNFLFRSYYAIGPMTNSKGQSTSAVYGFIRSVQKIIKDFSPTHLIAVFDGPENKKSRREVYADYKMHRKGAPEDLYPQFEWAYQFCLRAGIPVLSVEGVEADDTMASIALFAEKQGAKVFLCSSDKDLMQLVNDHIFLVHAHKENLIIDAAKVEELYGVRPNQMLDLLAIMGDASDNIPGLPGFGQKTAASLLQQFGTLDALLAHPEQVKGEKKQETLRTERETALLSRTLATLNTTVEIPLDDEFYQLKSQSIESLTEFYRELNFTSLLRDLGAKQEDGASQKKEKKHIERREYHLVDTEAALSQLLDQLHRQSEICIDTETTSEQPMKAELVGIGFCWELGIAYYLPCNGSLPKKRVIEALQHFFSKATISVYGHNLKYDWHVLANYGISLHKISFDTILASYLLTPHNRRHNLDDLSLERLQKNKIPIAQLIGKGKQQITMLDVPVEQVKDYCCEDVDCTARLKELFSEELIESKLDKLLYEIELPLLPILAKMERFGIYLDQEKLKGFGAEFAKEIAHLKHQIFSLAGVEFNLNSPLQLSKILYERLGLKPHGKKQTETSTNAAILEQLAADHPIAARILEYRTLEKLRSTYVEALPLEINSKTGRIHCTFNQSVTATGRLSCQDPNLQNIPIRSKQGMMIRSCFEPQKKGWSYLSADYSQIELRLLAHFCKDPNLLKAFKDHEDVHTYTASLLFDVQKSQVTPEMRSQAKAVNFGILYGQGPYGLSQQTSLSMSEASQFIKTYFERYPAVSTFIEECKKQANQTGVATTLTGRTRPLPDLTNKNPTIRAAAERLAVNTPLQGTAADLIKLAMIAIDKELTTHGCKGAMILQIHDELIFEVPDSEIPFFQKLVKEKMERVFTLNVPLEVSISVGKNWAEC